MTVTDYNDCVRQYSDGLFRFIVKNVKDEEWARDVVQDAFEKLWKKHEEVEAEKAKSYLFTTGYRTMIDQIRREKKKGDFEEVGEAQFAHDQHYSDLNDHLHAALDRLPEVQKSVVLLRDYEGYSYKEIEDITGLGEAQVKVYIYRARIALKKYLVSIDYVV
ncbi:MAG: RNA polymerase sigma factor [Flavobacteriales bacterium]|nr:RNA polymerase sigma factor [Flavobacteriales bacterium]